MHSHFLQACGASVLAAILMGSLGFFVRGVSIPPEMMAFYRFSIGFVLIAGVVLYGTWKKKETFSFSLHAFNSGIAIALCIVFYFIAITKIPIGMAAFLLYLAPIFASLGEIIFLKQKPSIIQTALITSAFVGMLLVVLFAPQSVSSEKSGGYFEGTVLGLLAAISYAFYIVLNRKIPENMGLKIRCFWQFLAAVIVVAAINFNQSFSVSWHDLPYVASVGLLQGFLVIILIAFAMRYLSVIQYGTLAYLEPVVAITIGYMWFSESLHVLQCAGFILIIISAMIQGIYTIKKIKKGV